ncbi:FAD/NAD(P)-binding domain-containing protein [Penicillium odoratum]|uniref:FAD/NAD(P)-binding domain-containing protein n=1 Tax=Penicillium odoratum TaxID=1167516 RepID=UPI002547B575|nr:FAD/NAD(P)-binding domain-containing protein [Penicillium odoratum]KAJ5772544.1 FAD/NAD(P)-binding domain-containing protein [Penicillium odoratum]
MEQVDVAIIGAGWHGIAAAKTYHAAYPSQKMVILDGASSVGGVWAKERIYHGLKTNNLLGSYEFSDFPMSEEYFAVRQGQHIPGDVVCAYFEASVKKFGLGDKLRLNCRVESAEYASDRRWTLSIIEGSPKARENILKTSKLIVAAGLTSRPFMPQFAGVDDFRSDSHLLHFHDFASHEADILEYKTRVTVLGGSKSAWDVVYSCATRGLAVDWVIRESGYGPTWMAPAYVGWPFKRMLESFPVTRFCSLFSPCAWNQEAGTFYTWLQSSWLGRKIMDAFWDMMQLSLERTNRYREHLETQKLRPSVSPFWVATSLGILNYSTDFFDLVREGKVRVHIADIDRLSRKRVHLSNQEELDADILICCTGWEEKSGIRFLPEDISTKLGFPGNPDVIPKHLREEVNQLINHQFPKLREHPPSKRGHAPDRNPLRLARFMVPPAMFPDRSIVFLGYAMTLNTTLLAEVQALWAAAFLNNEFPASSPLTTMTIADWMLETTKHTEFGRWRSPRATGGHRYPNFVFDILPYLDLLLRDLGISTRRKAGFWAHWMQPHGMNDYCGLFTEWRTAMRNTLEKQQTT